MRADPAVTGEADRTEASDAGILAAAQERPEYEKAWREATFGGLVVLVGLSTILSGARP